MTRVLTIDNPSKLPFPLLDAWPHDDQTVSSVSIDSRVAVLIPYANLLRGERDPLTHIISEANRVLVPGGTLDITAPYHLCPYGIGHPFQQRIFNEPTWYAYGCPEETAHTLSEKDEETGEVVATEEMRPVDPNTHGWNWWHGTDFGVKMRLLSIRNDKANWLVFYRKFNEGEYEG